MAKEASFDIVSEMNMEEIKNSIQLATKEIANRFDFKGSISEIKLEKEKLNILLNKLVIQVSKLIENKLEIMEK